MYELIKKQFTKIVVSLVVVLIGVCCIIFGSIYLAVTSAGQSDALTSITKGIGISLVIASSLSLISHIFGAYTSHNHKVLAVYGSASIFILTIGSFFTVHPEDSSLFILEIMDYTPFFYLGFGSLFLIDSILNLRFNVIKHKVENAVFFVVIESFISFCLLALGIVALAMYSVDDINYKFISSAISLISFGTLVIMYGLLLIVSIFKKLPKFEEVMLTSTPDFSKVEEVEEIEEIEEIEED